jgi:hypothetical protein
MRKLRAWTEILHILLVVLTYLPLPPHPHCTAERAVKLLIFVESTLVKISSGISAIFRSI